MKKKSLRAGLGAGQDHLGKHRSDVTNPDFELQIGEGGGWVRPIVSRQKDSSSHDNFKTGNLNLNIQ